MNTNTKTINRLKELREEKGLTMYRLAESTGIVYSTIRRIETEERKMSVPQLIAVADYFGVSTDYILCRTDKREVNR